MDLTYKEFKYKAIAELQCKRLGYSFILQKPSYQTIAEFSIKCAGVEQVVLDSPTMRTV